MDRSGNRRFLPILCNMEEAETHILDDEKTSREYIDQMWAEAMEIYRSGKCQLRLPKEMEKELCEYQKQFMQEDTKKELILDYLEHYEGSMVCSRQLYSEALGNDGNPAQWEIREINDIMNNCSDWIAFSNPRHFPEPYRRQKGWEKPDNRGQDFQPITKETIDTYNTSDTRGTSQSYGLNYQKLGRELMSQDRLALMDGGKCILQVRGVRPFFSDKVDITANEMYKELSDFDKKNQFDIEKYVSEYGKPKFSKII